MAQGPERTSGRKMISRLGAYQTSGVGKGLVVPRSPGRSLRDWTREGGGPSVLRGRGDLPEVSATSWDAQAWTQGQTA